MKIIKWVVTLVILLALASCAQVPKEATTLSVTLGSDLVKTSEAHIYLAKLHFGDIKKRINQFVDNVYAPYAIQYVLARHHERFTNTNTSDDGESIFIILDYAVKHPDNALAQKNTIDAMGKIVNNVKKKTEEYRRELLAPVENQEAIVINNITQSYRKMHYANAVVTGHLASIRKVHDTQNEMFELFGVEGLRENVGKNLASTSDAIAEYIDKGEKIGGKVGSIVEKGAKLEGIVSDVKGKITKIWE